MNKKIGFIGLGIMGYYMAAHLIEAGYELHVYDIMDSAVDRVVKLGAKANANCKEVAAASDIVISMVPDSRMWKRSRWVRTVSLKPPAKA